MRRNALVGILLVVMFVSSIGMFGTAGASAGEWQYQKEILIEENSGKTLTDYPIQVDLKGDDFPSKAEIDGVDIRFYDAEGKELSYWIEEYDYSGKTARIWVKVPSILPNEEVNIQMCYGNEKTGSVSDGNAVFEFFDDFFGYSVDQSKWYLEGTPSISNGILHLDRVGGADESIKSKMKYGDNYALRTKALFYDVSNKQSAFIGFLDAAAQAPHAVVQTYIPYYKKGDVVGGHTNDKNVNIMDPLGEYTNRFYAYEVRRINGGASYYVEGSPEIRQPAAIGVDLPIKAMAEITDGAKVDLDWILVRKYTSPEPTVTIYEMGGGGCGRITNWKTMCQGVYSPGQKVGAEMEFENLMGGGYNFKGVIIIRSPTGDEYTNSEVEWVPSAPNPHGKFAAGDALYVTIPEGASAGNYDMKLELWNDDTDELCDATEWKEDLFTVEGNTCPVLSDGKVEPLEGGESTNFGFSVTYKDGYGDEPVGKHVRIIGFQGTNKVYDETEEMIRGSGDVKMGVTYSYSTTLPAAEFRFYFYFSDGECAAYLPEGGYPGFEGPNVNGVTTGNHPPTATKIEPTSDSITIEPGDTQEYKVKAEDVDEEEHNNLKMIEWFVDDVLMETDAADGTSAEVSFSYTFENAGTFTVKATVYDEQMELATITWYVASNQFPIANADGPYSGFVGKPVQFDASSSYDPDGSIVQYMWKFGDGISVCGPPTVATFPTHSYGSAGAYTVELTVKDNDDNTATACTQVDVCYQGKVLDVPYVTQGRAPWCMLASATMLLRYYGEDSSLWQNADWLDWDCGDGIFAGLASERELLTGEILQKPLLEGDDPEVPYNYKTDDWRWGYSDRPSTFNYIKNNIDADRPVLMIAANKLKHAVVIVGYDDSGGEDIVYVNDPSGALVKDEKVVQVAGYDYSYPYIKKAAKWEEVLNLLTVTPGTKFIIIDSTEKDQIYPTIQMDNPTKTHGGCNLPTYADCYYTEGYPTLPTYWKAELTMGRDGLKWYLPPASCYHCIPSATPKSYLHINQIHLTDSCHQEKNYKVVFSIGQNSQTKEFILRKNNMHEFGEIDLELSNLELGEYEPKIEIYEKNSNDCYNKIKTVVLPPLPISTVTHIGEETFTNTIGMEFVRIPAGEFEMGSPSGEGYSFEGPVHHVTIKNPFYLGRYEVTQKQWRAIMGDNPSYFTGDDLPVEQVSWDDVQEFIKKLNEKEGTDKYRLQSEAEWEYACRAGTTTRYSFGDSESELGDYDWYENNSDSKTHMVGLKKPNSWGLYDKHGNVWEWVQDEWHYGYDGAPTDGGAWESGDSANRVVRGGGWRFDARFCRSTFRGSYGPRHCDPDLGFRILQEV